MNKGVRTADSKARSATLLRKTALILACAATLPAAAGGALPAATDLAQDGERMRREATPMAVLYSQNACSWCDRARSHLVPMSQAPDAGALFRQIDIDRATPLVDFAGTHSTHERFAAAENIRFVPMLVLYGPSGERLAEPVVGMGIADFYAEYVSRAITEARARMRPETR